MDASDPVAKAAADQVRQGGRGVAVRGGSRSARSPPPPTTLSMRLHCGWCRCTRGRDAVLGERGIQLGQLGSPATPFFFLRSG